jgi:hypothetical protein
MPNPSLGSSRPILSFYLHLRSQNFLLHVHKITDICLLALKKPKFANKCETVVEVNAENGFFNRFLDTTANNSMGKMLLSTEGGGFGMGPSRARTGDRIVVLKGCGIIPLGCDRRMRV